MRRLFAVALALLLAAVGTLAQGDVLPVPPLSARVIDQTATLSEPQRTALEGKLAAFERKAGSQLVVLLVPSTAQEDIAAYAQRVGEQWKIGRRGVGDGLLVVVAKNDRRVRIEVAKALEGAVPDLAAKQIIDRAITPAFRAGDFAGGLNAAIDQLSARITGEALPAPGAPQRESRGLIGDLSPIELLIFTFIALPIVASVARGVFGRGGGALAASGATGAVAWLVSSSLLIAAAGAVIGLLFGLFARASSGGRSGRYGSDGPVIWSGGGGGGWSDGGGGFSSGGGGDFGGGGASGDW